MVPQIHQRKYRTPQTQEQQQQQQTQQSKADNGQWQLGSPLISYRRNRSFPGEESYKLKIHIHTPYTHTHRD